MFLPESKGEESLGQKKGSESHLRTLSSSLLYEITTLLQIACHGGSRADLTHCL